MAIARIERATVATEDLPLPASAPAASAEQLPIPSRAPSPAAADLPLPAACPAAEDAGSAQEAPVSEKPWWRRLGKVPRE